MHRCDCVPDGNRYACVCSACGAKVNASRPKVFHVCDAPDVSGLSAKSVSSGPGTELKALLKSWLGIVTKPGCKCNARAKTMDDKGCQWCLNNLDEIVGWLQEEHTRQKILLPFVPLAAKQLVKLAVRNARKKGTCR